MKTSQIFERARLLADIPTSDFITIKDELHSLNESWKDIYSELTNSDEDYYVKEATFTTWTQDTDSTVLITLPDDVYKIRTVDYLAQGDWTCMEKFALNERNDKYSQPKYRWKNDKLWILGATQLSAVRISYYPPAIYLEAPGTDTTILTQSVAPSPVFQGPNNTVIRIETIGTSTSCTFRVYYSTGQYDEYTLVNNPGFDKEMLGVRYLNGWFYVLMYRAGTAEIYRLPQVPGSYTFAQNKIITKSVAPDAALSLSVDTDKITITTTTGYFMWDIFTFADVTASYVTTEIPMLTQEDYFISSGSLWSFTSGDLQIAADSFTLDDEYLYVLENRRVNRILRADPTIIETLRDDVYYLSPTFIDGSLMILDKDDGNYKNISIYVDIDLDYPLNLVPELLSYQMAIDYKRKQSGDITLLKDRLGELWTRFADVIKRDEYTRARVQNVYNRRIPL